MSERKELGKIKAISFGYGGYDDAMIGVSVTLGGTSTSVNHFRGTWASEPSKGAEWTKADQIRVWGEVVAWLGDLMKAANVRSIDELQGVPVEITYHDLQLHSWRILTEVV